MSPTRPTAPNTTPNAADMTDDNSPHDETRSTDPDLDRPLDDATSAADADWLAELRAAAKQRNTTLADLVTEAEAEAEAIEAEAVEAEAEAIEAEAIEAEAVEAEAVDIDIDIDDVALTLDDEATTGSPTALDDIRRIAREEREQFSTDEPAAIDAPTAVPDTEPAAVAPTLAPPALAAPPEPPPAARPAGGARLTPEMPPAIRSAAPRLESINTDASVPRWEAPPRLEAAAQADGPGILERSRPQRGPDWRITALAVAVALLLGVVITLVFFRDGSSEPVDENPDGTTLVDGSPVPEAPVGPPEDG